MQIMFENEKPIYGPRRDPEGLALRINEPLESDKIWNNFNWLNVEKSHIATYQFLGPHSKRYVSKLRPIFLNDFKTPDVLSQGSHFMARDGVLSLSWFFFKHPRPPLGESVILIHQKCAGLVPQSWRKRVAFYEFVSNEASVSAAKVPKKCIFLLSLFDERHTTLDHIERILTQMAQARGMQLRGLDIECALIPQHTFKSSKINLAENGKLSVNFVTQLCSRFGTRVRGVNWESLCSENLLGVIFHDFNEHQFYYSDSAIIQEMMSRGAVSISQWGAASGAKPNIELSFFHGANVHSDWTDLEEAQANRFQKMIQDFTGTD
ncbi:MAG: hypothetical protein AABZ55_15910, partial [Bdellovibrionota bacterium]